MVFTQLYHPAGTLLIGLATSFRRTGGTITEWYFVGYQFLFLFWPWNFELRFQLPVAPLAFLFMWRGGVVLWRWIGNMPRKVGTLGFAVAALGILSSAVWGWRIRHPSALACIAIWFMVACLSVAILAGGQNLMRKLRVLLESTVSVRGVRLSRVSMAGGVCIICILAAGVWMQIMVGLQNLRLVPEMDPDIEAAEWIRGHSAPDDVVMARWEARAYHYSGHRVIWFPASTDPQLLKEGILRHHIRLIIVTDEDDSESYWKPSVGHCFRVLMSAYPARFHEVHQGLHEKVYEVVPNAMRVS